MTGAEAARQLLNSQGIYDVQIRQVAGSLFDHYDPRTKTVNLSESVYGSTSVAAIGVAAHECGHAMQDASEYVPLRLRGSMVPVVNIGAQLSWPMILIGVLVGGMGSPIVSLGILLFSLSVLFQLVTLPVEFNASARAVRLLDSTGILRGEEVGYTKQVLGAAALTYVAAAAGSILQLLRLIILFGDAMTDGTALREIAAEILTEILEKGQYTHLALFQALSKYQYLEKADRSFLKRIVDGTVEYKIQIDYIINAYSKTKVHKMKPFIRTLLRMSVYQIYYMDRVPDSAACNEAVRLAKKRGFSGLSGFVNGVLRSVTRGKGKLTFPDDSVRYSMPDWILSLWKENYGAETTHRMAQAGLEKRPFMVRFAESRAGKEEIFASLSAQGVTAEETAAGSGVYRLTGVDYPESLDAFREGLIRIQDLSSSLAGDAAGIKEGDFVLDVCGAPGGKGLHAADLLHGTGQVEIRDVSDYKVSLIKENIARSGCTNVSACAWNACEFDASMEQKADVVIADLPCSGLGIIGRKPDIKYNASMDGIRDLAALQRQMLSVVWQYVKPGGVLVYSTCTVNRLENDENRAWFLNEYPFEPVDISGRLGIDFQEDSLKEGYIQLYPGVHPCDGFFISVMKRKG